MFRKIFLLLTLLWTVGQPREVSANSFGQPTPTDSRLKTLLYSPNEVYQLNFIVGYQSQIEFSKDESISYVLFGDYSSWGYEVMTKGMIIRALDPGARTNLIVQTSKRKYIFDITSDILDEDEEVNNQLVYVVRFFYPETDVDDIGLYVENAPSLDMELPMSKDEFQSGGQFYNKSINFDYYMSGNGERITPISVFDDGARTFIKFKDNNALVPAIFALSSSNQRGMPLEIRLKTRIMGEYLVIDSIEPQLILRYERDLICIFNGQLTS